MTRQHFFNALPTAAGLPLRAAGRLLRSWRRRRQVRNTITMMHGLTDLQLKDIGLRRADIYRRFRS